MKQIKVKLSKDQLQKVMLSAIGFIGLVYVYFSFFLGPLNTSRNAMLGQIITRAFEEEDKPMLEKQQVNMAAAGLWSLQPVLLNIDSAAVRARRILARLIDTERASEDATSVRGNTT